MGIPAMIGMGFSALGGIFGAAGAREMGQAQANMYNYQAGIAMLNKQIAEQNARYAIASGEVEAQQSGMQTRYQIGASRAQQGASGLDVNRGSALAVRESEAEIGEQNQAIIRSNAQRTAYGFQTQAVQDQAQSQLYGMAAQQSIIAGNYGAMSSLLGAGASVASKWYQGSQYGMGLGMGF
jgi:hypothetical protein